MSEPWIGVEEAARYVGVSTKTIRRHALRMGATKLGTRLLFRVSAIDRFLESQSLLPRRGTRKEGAAP
jgi:excisionase family DNA binding protein